MRGRKLNVDFIADYISLSARDGNIHITDIINKAKEEILEIDNKIKDLQELKKKRTNLLDLVYSLEKRDKSVKSINFFNLHDLNTAVSIVDELDGGIRFENYDKNKLFLVLKQMVKMNILQKTNNNYIKGSDFDYFVAFIKEQRIGKKIH